MANDTLQQAANTEELRELAERLGYELVIDDRTGAQFVIDGAELMFVHRDDQDDDTRDWLTNAELFGKRMARSSAKPQTAQVDAAILNQAESRGLLEIIDDLNSSAKDGEAVAYFMTDCGTLGDLERHGVEMLADSFGRIGRLSAEIWDGQKEKQSATPTVDAARAMLRTLEKQCETLTEPECVEELARGEWDVQKVIPAGLGDPTDVGVNYTASHGWTLKGLRCQVALERFKEALLPPEESRVESAELENELAQSLEEASAYITQAPGIDSAPAQKLRTAITVARALIAALQDCADDKAA